MSQEPNYLFEMLERLLLNEIQHAEMNGHRLPNDGVVAVKADNILACIEGAKCRYAELDKAVKRLTVSETKISPEEEETVKAVKKGYVQGLTEGMDIGKEHGKALAVVFGKLSILAASLYQKKMEMLLSPQVVDGSVDYEQVLSVSKSFIQLAFDCGAMAMFMNKQADVQHIDELQKIVADFTTK